MSRDTIAVRECDRCKTKVEARELETFDGWGMVNADGERKGERIGIRSADICPKCFNLLLSWFGEISRKRDAERTHKPKPKSPDLRRIAVVQQDAPSTNSPEFDAYIGGLDEIASLDELQNYQARHGLTLIEWLADPASSEPLKAAHYAAYARLESDPT